MWILKYASLHQCRLLHLTLQTNVGKAYETVVTDSMSNAAHELFTNEKGSEYVTENNILDITVSADGSWQKRGHSSLNGVVTLVASDTAKCVDYRVLSKHCLVQILGN